MNPCVDYCYLRFGRQYTSECDNNCDFAKEVKKRKELEEKFSWRSYPDNKPTEEKQYLVTQQITPTRKIISLRGWSNNLYKKDPSDFFKDQERSGWYDRDPEWGYYEVTDVIGWQPAPDPM